MNSEEKGGKSAGYTVAVVEAVRQAVRESVYAAKRILELEAENERLRTMMTRPIIPKRSAPT